MFTESDRNMLESVYSFIYLMKKKACERGDFYSVADHFRKRIDNLEHDMNVRTDEIKDVTHKDRIELERTIRPDIEAIKSKLGVFVGEENVKKDEKGNDDSDAKNGFMLIIDILKLTKILVDLDKKIETAMERLEKNETCVKTEKSDVKETARKSGRRRKDA